jgi:uncharacterized protein (TIGR02284 family)
MSHANAHDIHVLNDLTGAALDSADGYGEAARETDNPGFRDLFERRGFERRQVAADLRAAVEELGGEVHADGSILAKASRAFHDIRHALLGDELSVVGPIEAAEDGLKGRFETALNDSAISATTRETIRRAYAAVKDGHDQMRELKHSLEGQRDASNRLFPQ